MINVTDNHWAYRATCTEEYGINNSRSYTEPLSHVTLALSPSLPQQVAESLTRGYRHVQEELHVSDWHASQRALTTGRHQPQPGLDSRRTSVRPPLVWGVLGSRGGAAAAAASSRCFLQCANQTVVS